jgi:Family of unknown function (DUF6188)
MYGLKPDDIAYLKSTLDQATLQQICVGEYDLQFHFHPNGNVSIWAKCELINEVGEVIEVWPSEDKSRSFRFLELLGSAVIDIAIDTQKSFRLVFGNGNTLRVIDDSEQYESFSVGNLIA